MKKGLFSRRNIIALLLLIGFAGFTQAAPENGHAMAESITGSTAKNSTPLPKPEITALNPPVVTQPTTSAQPQRLSMDLSVWGMYQHADVVVKIVMIGLVLSSIVTWTILFAKGRDLYRARRRLQQEQASIGLAIHLDDALERADEFSQDSVSNTLLHEAQNERLLSAKANDNNGTKERTSFRLERRVAAISRQMGRGNGFLATIGAIAPFIGLFGTVWGIMNSFIGIAHSQTTNLAVVAPGIAEALLATALGLVAAIPAVVIYNVFARIIGNYRAQVADVAAQVLLLLSRDLDLAHKSSLHTQKLRAG